MLNLTSFLDELEKISEDLVSGGKADNVPPSKFSPAAVAKGQKVEMEHTNNPALAREIARDHLEEFPNYYSALSKMEEGLKAKESEAVSAELKSKVEALLKAYSGKEVPDSKIRALAEAAKASPHSLESYVYSLASKHVSSKVPKSE